MATSSRELQIFVNYSQNLQENCGRSLDLEELQKKPSDDQHQYRQPIPKVLGLAKDKLRSSKR